MSAREYWVSSENFSYGIHDSFNYDAYRGPFKTLAEAKKCARELIANDRLMCEQNLAWINSYRAADFEKVRARK